MLMVVGAGALLAAGFFMLWWSSDKMVDHALSISAAIGIPAFVVGSLLVAVLTSIPEMIVGLFSVWRGAPEIAVGDIIGSNMCDVSFVLAAPLCFVRRLTLGKGGRAGILFMLMMTSLIMMFYLQIGFVTRSAGLVLIVLYFISIYTLWKRHELDVEEYKVETVVTRDFGASLFGLVWTSALALGAGAGVVMSGQWLSDYFGIFPGIMGELVFSLGTSIPEIAVGISAARRGATDFVIGSAIGSILSQAFLVLGVIAIASKGGRLAMHEEQAAIPFIAALYGYLAYRVYAKSEVTRFDGMILSGIFLMFYVVRLKALI